MELLNGYRCLHNSDDLRRSATISDQTLSPHSIEVYNDFRQTVSLMCLLGPIKGARKVSDTFQSDEKSLEGRWKKFLANMAWLADCEPAGHSTTSIAARMTLGVLQTTSIKYLISGNKKVPPDTIYHLKAVLSRLKQMSQLSSKEKYTQQEMDLSHACIEFSSKKARSYFTRLTKTMVHMQTEIRDYSDAGTLLKTSAVTWWYVCTNELRRLFTTAAPHRSICPSKQSFAVMFNSSRAPVVHLAF